MQRRTWTRLIAGMTALVAQETAAHADPTPEDSKRADALFEEGTKLMDQGDFARGCPALQQSLAIDPAPGTALALARCHEKAGRIATAWAAYLDAEARARKAGQTPRADAARDQAAALAPRVPHVVVTVGSQIAALPGLVVELDGLAIATTSVGTQLAVDPGEHRVEVRATGKATSTRTLKIAEGESVSVAFASLDAEVAGPTAPGAPDASDGPRPLLIAGLVVGGVGVAGVGVGAVFGLLASGASSDSDESCAPFQSGDGGTHEQYLQCVDDRNGAGSLADVSTIAFIAGGVLAAGGLGLVLLDGAGRSDDAALVVIPGPGTLQARGNF